MLKIKNNTELYLTRGDSVQMQITILDANGDPYTPEAGDVIRFALKKTYISAEPEILKTLNNSNLVLNLTPEETKNFSTFNSPYVWDIELSNEASGIVDTFMSGKLFILEEVY